MNCSATTSPPNKPVWFSPNQPSPNGFGAEVYSPLDVYVTCDYRLTRRERQEWLHNVFTERWQNAFPSVRVALLSRREATEYRELGVPVKLWAVDVRETRSDGYVVTTSMGYVDFVVLEDGDEQDQEGS